MTKPTVGQRVWVKAGQQGAEAWRPAQVHDVFVSGFDAYIDGDPVLRRRYHKDFGKWWALCSGAAKIKADVPVMETGPKEGK